MRWHLNIRNKTKGERSLLDGVYIDLREEGLHFSFQARSNGTQRSGTSYFYFDVDWLGNCRHSGSEEHGFQPSNQSLGYDYYYEPYPCFSLTEFLNGSVPSGSILDESARILPPFLNSVVRSLVQSSAFDMDVWDGARQCADTNDVIALKAPKSKERHLWVCQSIQDSFLAALAKNPRGLFSIEPRVFEEVVAELLSRRGFKIEIMSGQKDGGKDIIGVKINDLGDADRYLFECKRYKEENRVDVGIVRSLIGANMLDPATRYCIVTTSSFTHDARLLERALWHQLSLKDFDDLQAWLRLATAGK